MAISRNQKEVIVDSLRSSVLPQKAVVILTTHSASQSLNSAANFTLRSSARKQGVVVQVVKNTLIQKVFDSVPELVGPSYLAYLENGEQSDEVTAPKIILDIVDKDFKDQFGVVGAVVNGEFFDSQKAKQLSKTPTLQQSMASLAGSLNQLASKIAIGVKEVPSGIARSLSEYSKTIS